MDKIKRKKYLKDYSKEYRKKHRERLKEKYKKRYYKYKKLLNRFKLSKGCSICGYTKCGEALEFHHLNPDEKEFSVANIYNVNKQKLKKEIAKCIVVCANCHREIHREINNGREH